MWKIFFLVKPWISKVEIVKTRLVSSGTIIGTVAAPTSTNSHHPCGPDFSFGLLHSLSYQQAGTWNEHYFSKEKFISCPDVILYSSWTNSFLFGIFWQETEVEQNSVFKCRVWRYISTQNYLENFSRSMNVDFCVELKTERNIPSEVRSEKTTHKAYIRR